MIYKFIKGSGYYLNSHGDGDPGNGVHVLLSLLLLGRSHRRSVAVADQDDVRTRIQKFKENQRVFVNIANSLKE